MDEGIRQRAMANRHRHPFVTLHTNATLRKALNDAAAGVRAAHKDGRLPFIRAAVEIYFIIRYEHDYRQAQGC